jgi:hypothetical protein
VALDVGRAFRPGALGGPEGPPYVRDGSQKPENEGRYTEINARR